MHLFSVSLKGQAAIIAGVRLRTFSWMSRRVVFFFFQASLNPHAHWG
jgi:hypothetical protein